MVRQKGQMLTLFLDGNGAFSGHSLFAFFPPHFARLSELPVARQSELPVACFSELAGLAIWHSPSEVL